MTDTNLRPELTHHLMQRLQAFEEGFRRNLALLGPPGGGKTFQLHQLMRTQPQTVTTVYCALYRESCRSFIRRLLCAILQAGLPEARASWTHAQHPLEELLEHAERQLPRSASMIQPIEGLLTRRLFADAFVRALDTIPILAEERGQPCMLILDEFVLLEELGLTHAFHELGKRVMTWPSVLFILTSSSLYRARMILRERLQLLFGQFELITLGSVPPSTAGAWVEHELGGLAGASRIAPFLIQWLGAYPWYLSVFLKRLKELAALGRLDSTEALFLQTAWDLIGSIEGSLHQWCVSRTEGLMRHRPGTRAIEALIHIAGGARTATDIGKQIGRAGLANALQLLTEHDLAKRNGTCWTVTDPMLRCWLSTVLAAQRTDALPDHQELRQRFEHDVRTLWVHWAQLHELSFPEQVVGLFTKFSDETVSLDSKTGRLPKFHSVSTHRSDTPGTGAYLIAQSQGKHWCAAIQEGRVDENVITEFDAFCRQQQLKPTRKVVITKSTMDQHARLLAKAANMWVWELEALNTLRGLYGPL